MADSTDTTPDAPSPKTSTTKAKSTDRSGKAAKPAAKATSSKAEAAAEASETVSHFSRAFSEVRAAARALRDEARSRTDAYREKYQEQLASARAVLGKEAGGVSEKARAKAASLAGDGKLRASEALQGFGKLIADNAGVIDSRLGARYGDYVRAAARHLDDTAARLEAKDLGTLGDDVRRLVRDHPVAALGAAAGAGFVLARLLRERA